MNSNAKLDESAIDYKEMWEQLKNIFKKCTHMSPNIMFHADFALDKMNEVELNSANLSRVEGEKELHDYRWLVFRARDRFVEYRKRCDKIIAANEDYRLTAYAMGEANALRYAMDSMRIDLAEQEDEYRERYVNGKYL